MIDLETRLISQRDCGIALRSAIPTVTAIRSMRAVSLLIAGVRRWIAGRKRLRGRLVVRRPLHPAAILDVVSDVVAQRRPESGLGVGERDAVLTYPEENICRQPNSTPPPTSTTNTERTSSPATSRCASMEPL